MKNKILALLAVVTLAFTAMTSMAQTNSLASLGTDNLTVDGGSTTAGYSQTTTNLSLVSPFVLGDTLGGIFVSPYDWSAYSDTNSFTLGLFMSAPGASPNLPFNIQFINAALDQIVGTYEGSAVGLSSTPTFISLSTLASNDLSSIGGLQFTWDGSGSGTVVVDSIAVAVVPEPSTWALLGLSALTFAAIAWRRRSTVRRC